MEANNEKYVRLSHMLKEWTKEDVVVAFSGGADSALLLRAACDAALENGTDVYNTT